MKIVFLHGLGQRAADWDQVASQFPNARLYAVPHAGHELNTDAPDTVAEIVRESYRVSPL